MMSPSQPRPNPLEGMPFDVNNNFPIDPFTMSNVSMVPDQNGFPSINAYPTPPVEMALPNPSFNPMSGQMMSVPPFHMANTHGQPTTAQAMYHPPGPNLAPSRRLTKRQIPCHRSKAGCDCLHEVLIELDVRELEQHSTGRAGDANGPIEINETYERFPYEEPAAKRHRQQLSSSAGHLGGKLMEVNALNQTPVDQFQRPLPPAMIRSMGIASPAQTSRLALGTMSPPSRSTQRQSRKPRKQASHNGAVPLEISPPAQADDRRPRSEDIQPQQSTYAAMPAQDASMIPLETAQTGEPDGYAVSSGKGPEIDMSEFAGDDTADMAQADFDKLFDYVRGSEPAESLDWAVSWDPSEGPSTGH